MTRTMYDSVSPGSIPAGATLVAGYADGLYANLPAMRARFPHATVVEIAVFARDNLGVVLDVETGDATPSQAPGWVAMRRRSGVDPTVYCNSSTWPAVRAAFQSAGVAEPHYWIAQYDGNVAIPAGAIAKQYQDPGPYDLSAVADYWPGVDPAPVPTPTPEPDMPLTPDDINSVATAVWSYQIPRAATADSPAVMVPAWSPLAWTAHDQQALAGAITTRIAALEATVSVLATAVGNAQPGVDTAQLVAAVDAAIAAAVVHVDVNVTGTPTTPTA